MKTLLKANSKKNKNKSPTKKIEKEEIKDLKKKISIPGNSQAKQFVIEKVTNKVEKVENMNKSTSSKPKNIVKKSTTTTFSKKVDSNIELLKTEKFKKDKVMIKNKLDVSSVSPNKLFISKQSKKKKKEEGGSSIRKFLKLFLWFV